MKLIASLIVLIGMTSTVFAGNGYVVNGNQQQYIKDNNSALLSKVIVQNKIQVFDTQLITPHKQFFRVVPQYPYTEQIVIERIVSPKEYIIQEQVVGKDELIQRYIAPERQTVIVEQEIEQKEYQYTTPIQCVQKFRAYCNSH